MLSVSINSFRFWVVGRMPCHVFLPTDYAGIKLERKQVCFHPKVRDWNTTYLTALHNSSYNPFFFLFSFFCYWIKLNQQTELNVKPQNLYPASTFWTSGGNWEKFLALRGCKMNGRKMKHGVWLGKLTDKFGSFPGYTKLDGLSFFCLDVEHFVELLQVLLRWE